MLNIKDRETSMKAGTILHRFTAKDGKKVILRTPRYEDIDNLVDVTNSIVDEGIDITNTHKISREEYAKLFDRRMKLMEKGEVFRLVAEVEGKVIAGSELRKQTGKYSKHIGNIGIAVKRGYRDIGIGTSIIKTLISKAKVMNMTVIDLAVVSSNKRAIHVYEKLGFIETGRIPKYYLKDSEYFDEVIMVKEIL
jgi:ribosomal protein S18 acetylase RimI-like enzyme